MKDLVMYREMYVREERNEETGEIITPASTKKEVFVVPLEKIIKVKVQWGSVELLTIDGKITKFEEIDEMYYR